MWALSVLKARICEMSRWSKISECVVFSCSVRSDKTCRDPSLITIAKQNVTDVSNSQKASFRVSMAGLCKLILIHPHSCFGLTELSELPGRVRKCWSY